MKNNFRQFFLVGAIASICSALTTAVLIYGPGSTVGGDVLAQAQLHDDWLYLYKKWVLFFHPQLALIACVSAGFALFRDRPALVVISLFYLLVWAVTEMTQQAFVIDALNQIWRPEYLKAKSADEQAKYAVLLAGFRGISDSQYFLLLFGFGVGSVLLGLAFFSAPTVLARGIGVCQIAIGALSLVAFTGYYLGASFVVPSTDWIYGNLYGVVQLGVRVAIGVWLWGCWKRGYREASEGTV